MRMRANVVLSLYTQIHKYTYTQTRTFAHAHPNESITEITCHPKDGAQQKRARLMYFSASLSYLVPRKLSGAYRDEGGR